MDAPREPLPRLFLRFLRFGALAWGGPVPQIAMVREELVERERWVSSERFNRVLAVYQVLPGPEAHELCVYFGTVAGGRAGGLLAGLGFMLPGFALILLLSWAYVRFGLAALAPGGMIAGLQAAVLALIAVAVVRIGRHVVTGGWLLALAAAAFAADLLGVHFGVSLAFAGGVYAALRAGRPAIAGAIGVAAALLAAFVPGLRGAGGEAPALLGVTADPGAWRLFLSGLLAGLLTFGGAYTVIPFLRGATVSGGWMTGAVFLDGLAIAGVLPAPLVIFGTFVGYVGGGFPGALAMTAGIFLPAFGFTLLGHARIERLIAEPRLHAFLDGVTAGVEGLIAATAVRLAPTSVPDLRAGAVAVLALTALLVWRAKAAVAIVVLSAGAAGALLARF